MAYQGGPHQGGYSQHNVLEHMQKQVLAQDVYGTVKWYNPEKQYGFIRAEGTNEDVFVHMFQIRKPAHDRVLYEGEYVMMDIVQGRRGREATNVRTGFMQ